MLSRIQAIFVTFVLFVVCYLVVVVQLISVSTSPGGLTQDLDSKLGVKTNDSLSRGGQLTSQALLASNRAPNGSNSGTINTGSLKTSHSSSANDSANAGGQVLKRPSSRDAHPLPVPKCSDPLCTEFLSKKERGRLDRCLRKSYNAYHLLQNGTCRFMSQSGRAPVALASYPGSGNTWLRGLLETATGVCTGSVYCGLNLRVKGFTGEFIVSGAVLVVKTHLFPSWKDNKGHSGGGGGVSFDSAVFLVRNPLDALVAEWNRGVSDSHVKSAGKEMFGANSKWVHFLREQVPHWQSMTKNWITSHGRHASLVVKYEDLQENASREVKRILSFLQMPYRDQEVDERLARGFDSFHRSHKPDFEHYTPGQKQRVLRAISDTIQLLNRSRLSHLLDIHDYLHPKHIV